MTAQDQFEVWIERHPGATAREAWNAAIDMAYELTDTACRDLCGGPLRILLSLRSRGHNHSRDQETF